MKKFLLSIIAAVSCISAGAQGTQKVDAIVVGLDGGRTIDDCHTFTPPEEDEEAMVVATVTFINEAIEMKIKNGEATLYTLNDSRPLETYFAHTFKLTAYQDPANTGDYYTTFHTGESAYKLPGDVTAYIATLGKHEDAEVMALTPTDTIHVREAVILKVQPKTPAGNKTEITLMPSCNRRAASPDNMLTGTDAAIGALGDNDCAFSLGQNGVGFYKWKGRPLGANKAYLNKEN